MPDTSFIFTYPNYFPLAPDTQAPMLINVDGRSCICFFMNRPTMERFAEHHHGREAMKSARLIISRTRGELLNVVSQLRTQLTSKGLLM
ncbi:MAG TPA: hypothetical protein VHR66_33030 [Gemmataceae bacterium]|jgi:hypothetical protein|nr:hypothetical protein [Gemmataceae bacterium]